MNWAVDAHSRGIDDFPGARGGSYEIAGGKWMFKYPIRVFAAAFALALFAPALALGADETEETMAEIERFREMIQDPDANPADLIALEGAELWGKPDGPNNVSLEKCDFGKGPGVRAGAYAELPRYFADTGEVMDAESRLLHCMVTIQGFTPEEAKTKWYSKRGQEPSKIEKLIADLATESKGFKINVGGSPQVDEMAEYGKYLFYRRSGPQDFGCVTCHAADGVRIRLQDLYDFTNKESAIRTMSVWPVYRFSAGAFWTMQRRLIDCIRQARWPEPNYPSKAVIALETFLMKNANGAEMSAPGARR